MRDQHIISVVDNAIDVSIRDCDAENLRDVERYVERYIDRHGRAMAERMSDWGVGRSGFVSAIRELSEGNFMYLRYVLPDVKHGRLSHDTVGDIRKLPRGLTGTINAIGDR